MLLDLLVGLAQGRYDRPSYQHTTKTWKFVDLRSRSLDVLAREYCGLQLSKDANIRLAFGQFRGKPIAELPLAFRDYALQDAVATRRVFVAQQAAIAQLKGANLLGEADQVRAAIALRDLDRRGVAVDRALAARLEARFIELQFPLQRLLVAAGLGRWEGAKPPLAKDRLELPVGICVEPGVWRLRDDGLVEQWRYFKRHCTRTTARPVFHLSTAAVQQRLEPLIDKDDPEVPRRADGTIGLEADYWTYEVPKDAEALQIWLKHERVKKVLSTYLALYSKTSAIYPWWHILGARSGRMSASQPNLQNIPKRKTGIRAIFVPHAGRLLTKADYSAQEMFTLCEVMLSMGIIGKLYETLTSGVDMHRYGAGLVLGKAPADVTKTERQAQKALHFGVPGGLGPKKLAAYAWSGYGVEWTEGEARVRRLLFLKAFPDIQLYLDRLRMSRNEGLRLATGKDLEAWSRELGVPRWQVSNTLLEHSDPTMRQAAYEAERQCRVLLPSGRQRANCRFTEAANTGFQGLASDVTKEACWRVYRAGLQMVMVVHDEIVIESVPDRVQEDAVALERAMLDAFVTCCPKIGRYARVEVTHGLDRWGPATDLEGAVLEV
jgi:DNA polymerase I-like protein with 3'-5' exonuclease and polymerase domains